MSIKGYVSNHESNLSIAGPCRMVRHLDFPGYLYEPQGLVTLELSFEVNVSELSTASSEHIHRLAMELVEEINRRLK
ncbi:hypothetical protein Erwinia_phage_Mauresque_00001 [Erwinia phage Mauresque]|nr:hypothetical protein Erwinia_phage_Calisson_00042 [Erwinia phage Calisson]WJN64043.1 hypothetical protein Erwinia_phage_Mauresque_00001 [Erwinia phage Mauresque]WJN64121.1 hypothetical protein Erwinia_phage_Navette_00001 [Erwinia phage Navette]